MAACELHLGDCLAVLPAFAAASVDTVLTDPQYGLGFMGKEWDHGVPGVPFWEAMWRVAKPGAMLLAFGHPRTVHRVACAIEDAGWEIRDRIMWMYGEGFPKSLDISKAIDREAGAEREVVPQGKPVKRMIPGADQNRTGSWIKDNGRTYQPGEEIPATPAAKLWHGWGTALKPAYEPIIVAMKPCEGTFATNALKHGVAGLNIDGGRVGTTVETWPSSRSYAPGQIQPGGKGRTQPTGKSPKGRWPANILHDGSDEVVRRMPSPHGAGAARTAAEGSHSGNQGSEWGDIGGPAMRFGDSGSAARFFYCAKASKAERNAGLNGQRNTHPTVKPVALMEYLAVLTATPTGGVVLDPFMGSGSTGIACARIGRAFIGIEKDKESYAIAERRIAHAAKQGLLFPVERGLRED